MLFQNQTSKISRFPPSFWNVVPSFSVFRGYHPLLNIDIVSRGYLLAIVTTTGNYFWQSNSQLAAFFVPIVPMMLAVVVEHANKIVGNQQATHRQVHLVFAVTWTSDIKEFLIFFNSNGFL